MSTRSVPSRGRGGVGVETQGEGSGRASSLQEESVREVRRPSPQTEAQAGGVCDERSPAGPAEVWRAVANQLPRAAWGEVAPKPAPPAWGAARAACCEGDGPRARGGGHVAR